MQSTSIAGNVESSGSTLERLNPRQVAVLRLPGTAVQVMDATDVQFQALAERSGLRIDTELAAWSFDDRIRFINYCRGQGIDLFATPNAKSSQSVPGTEVFAGDQRTLQAALAATEKEGCTGG
jgi:hypothetical protein